MKRYRERPILGVLVGISLLSLLFLNVGCGGGGRGGSGGAGGGDARLEAPVTATVTGSLNLPQALRLQSETSTVVPLQLESLNVLSILSKTSVSPTGDFVLEVIDENEGQMVFVKDQNDNLIMVAYVSPGDVEDNNVQIGPKEMALGLILFNPFLMILPNDDRENQILPLAEEHQLFPALVTEIEEALKTDPQNVLNWNIFPGIFEKSLAIGIEVLQSFGINNTGYASANNAYHDTYAVVGDEESPHLDDEPGPNILIVNPRHVFYGIEISNASQSSTDIELIAGKDSLVTIQLGWPPIVNTPPVTEDYNLGDGNFDFTFYKGFNFDEEDWLSPFTAPGKATWGNFLKTTVIAINFMAWCPLDNNDIKALIDYIDDPNLAGMNELAEAARDDWLAFLKLGLKVLTDNWDEVAYWIWQEWPGVKTVEYLDLAETVLDGISNALEVIKVLNEDIPFFFDFAIAPWKIEYCAEQANGILSETCRFVPPTGMINVNPTDPIIDDIVTFDASKSYDDRDPVNSLEVRWDFDGNGIFDTSWSTNKTETYIYTNSGGYTVKLEVKDTDGLIGQAIYYLYVQAEGDGTYPDTVIQIISVGDWPHGVAVTPDGSYVYVTNWFDNTVSVIRTSDNAVIDTIPVGGHPADIEVTPDGDYFYVTNDSDASVSVIRTSDNAVIKTVTVGFGPTGVAVTPNGSSVYVVNSGDDMVSVIRTSDNMVVKTILVGDNPMYVAVTPDGGYVYVTNWNDNAISVIRTSDNTVIDTTFLSGHAYGIGITPDGSYVYVTNNVDDMVSVIRTSDNMVVKTILVGDNPMHVAVTPDGDYVYVTSWEDDKVSVIKTTQDAVIKTIAVGDSPHGLAVTPNGDYVYVANSGDDTVSVIGY